MKTIRTLALAGAAAMLVSGAQAGQSSAQERAATRQLNLKQSQPVQSAAQDAGAQLAANVPPAAAPTMPVQQAASPQLAPMALNSMTDTPALLATAKVVDDKGTIVGAVQKVEIAGGQPTRVEIALLGSGQIIALDASHFSYDASNNVLMASLSKDQIVQMPAAPRG